MGEDVGCSILSGREKVVVIQFKDLRISKGRGRRSKQSGRVVKGLVGAFEPNAPQR